jgi:hypothetical protein
VNGLPVSIIRQNHIGMLNPNNSPAPNQNTFSRCSAAGFFASGALRNEVTNCTFIGNNYGMVIDQTKVQQQVVKNLFLNNRIAVFLRNLSGNNQHEVSDDRMETSQPTDTGTYSYTATLIDSNGCTATDTISLQVTRHCNGIVIKVNPLTLCGTTPGTLEYTISSGVDSTCTVSAQWILFNSQNLQFADSAHTILQAIQNPNAALTDSCQLVLTVVCNGDTCVFNNTKNVYLNPFVNASLTNPSFEACGQQSYTSALGTHLTLLSANIHGVYFFSDDPTNLFLVSSNSPDTLYFSMDTTQRILSFDWSQVQPNYLADTLCFRIMDPSHSCYHDTCVAINPCCPGPLLMSPSLNTWLNTLDNHPLYGNHVAQSGSYWTVTDLYIGVLQPVDVNCNVTFQNCTLLADGPAQLVVNPTYQLTFDSTEMRACSVPHQGLTCTANSTNNAFYNIRLLNGSRIQDAVCGISVSGGASLKVYRSTLDRNLRHISIQNLPNQTYPVSITASVFDCSAPLLHPELMVDEPPISSITQSAIMIAYVKQTPIGLYVPTLPGTNPYTNTIRNAIYGVSAYSSGISFFNNDVSLCNYGIYSKGNSYNTAQNIVTNLIGKVPPGNPLDSLTYSNTFHDCKRGIYLFGQQHNYLYKNKFVNDTHDGIWVDQNPSGVNYVYLNYALDCGIGVHFSTLMGNRNRSITQNVFRISTPETTGNSRGILLENPVIPNKGRAGIWQNAFSNLHIGIQVRGGFQVNINNNNFLVPFRHPTIGVIPNAGIWLQNSSQINTANNQVNAASSLIGEDAWWGCEGIRSDVTSFNTVTCNQINQSCDALLFLGASQKTTIQRNIMSNNYRGIYSDNPIVAAQGNWHSPQDNMWFGSSFIFHIHFPVSLTNPPLQKFFYRNNSSGTPFSPVNMIAVYPSSTFPVLTDGQANPCGIVPPGNVTELYGEVLASSTTTADTVVDNIVSFEKLNKEGFYKYLLVDSTLVLPPDVDAFKDSMALEDLGKIADISQYLVYPIDAVAYALATAKTQALTPIEVMEDLYKEVITMALSDNWLYKQLFTEAQTQRLRQISAYCPFEWGRGVYAARVLLSYVDEPYKEYYADCEQPALPEGKLRPADANMPNQKTGLSPIGNSPGTGLFPNPNQGNFTLNLPNPELATLVIEDVLGHVVYTGTVKGSTQLNLQGVLVNGLYCCRVMQACKLVLTTNMIIQP